MKTPSNAHLDRFIRGWLRLLLHLVNASVISSNQVLKGPVYFGITYAYISIMKEVSLVREICEIAVT